MGGSYKEPTACRPPRRYSRSGKNGGISAPGLPQIEVLEPGRSWPRSSTRSAPAKLSRQWGVDVSTTMWLLRGSGPDLSVKPITVPRSSGKSSRADAPEAADLDRASVAMSAIEHGRGHGNRCGPGHAEHALHARGGHRRPQPRTLCHRGAARPRLLALRHRRPDRDSGGKAPGRRHGLSGCGPASTTSSWNRWRKPDQGRPAARHRHLLAAQTTFGAARWCSKPATIRHC